MRKALFWFWPGTVVLALDRLTKWLLKDVQMTLIPGVLALTPAKNTGIAMGMFQGNALWIILTSVLILGMFAWLLKGMRPRGMAAFSLSLLIGGAMGNVIDRLVYGYVIDMFELLFIDFYIFNVADIGVVCGAVLCAVSLLLRPQDWSRK